MGHADLKKLLENSRLFKQFSPSVVDAVIPALTHCQFNAGALICLKGEPSDCLYIIQQGEVEVSVSSSEGKIILLGSLSDGDVFGEIGLLDKKPRTANVMAKTDASLYRLGSGDFDRLIKLFGPEELMALTSYVCFLFRSVTNNLEETIFLDASIRIAHKIQELCEKGGGAKSGKYEIEISQENLGRMAGLSREATNKALSRLEETGIIERKYKHIVVPDIDRLIKKLKED
jgi:CRP/FNR family cyclic AMP-dependent transcriptional regulator